MRLKVGKQLQREEEQEEQEEGAVLEKQEQEIRRERAKAGQGNLKKRKSMEGAELIPPDEQVDVVNRGKTEEMIMGRETKVSRKGGMKTGHGQENYESEDSEVRINF